MMTERDVYEISLFCAMTIGLTVVHPVAGFASAVVFGPLIMDENRHRLSKWIAIIESMINDSSVIIHSKRHDEMLGKIVAVAMGVLTVLASIINFLRGVF